MPTLVPTGRSRSAGVTASSTLTHIGGSQVFTPGLLGYAPGFNLVDTAAFGVGVSIRGGLFNKGYERDFEYEGPGYRIRWGIGVQFRIQVGGIPTAPFEILQGGGDHTPWEIVSVLPPSGDTGIATLVSGSATATLNASWTMREYLDLDSLGNYSERREPGSASLNASGSFTYHYKGHDLTGAFSYSQGWTDLILGSEGQYGASIFMMGVTEINASVGASMEGITWGGGVSGEGLSSEGLTATLTPNNPDLTNATYAQGTMSILPDWAYEFRIKNYDYQTGDEMEVPTRYEVNGNLISRATDGYHRYPASGYTSQVASTFSQWPYTSSSSRPEGLGKPHGFQGPNEIRVDDEWADEYGTNLYSPLYSGSFPGFNPGINAQYGLFSSPDFDAGTISVDERHSFRLFATDEHLTPVGETQVGMDGDAIRAVGAGFLVNRKSGYVFKPFGYRYYRFQLKGDSKGERLTLRLIRAVDREPDPEPDKTRPIWAHCDWHFTIKEGGVWQTCVFDIAHPHEAWDLHTFPFSPAAPRQIQPAQYQLLSPGEDTIVEVRLNSNFRPGFPPPTVFWLKDLEGYHLLEGDRTPALLIGPCMCRDGAMETANLPPAGYDTCNGYTSNFFKCAGGRLAFRLITNGVLSCNLFASERMGPTWNAWLTYFDDALNDTGIHFHPATPTLAFQGADGEADWKTRRPLWSPLQLEIPYPLQGVKRCPFAFGYYGFGNVRTGAYGPLLSYEADKVWNGELLGNCHGPQASKAGIPVALVDDNSGAEVTSATSDADGLVRFFGKYGTAYPFRNHPRTNSCALRQQYTGHEALGNLTYTAQGLRMNGYWLRSRQFRSRTAQDYASFFYTPDRHAILDRYPHWRNWLVRGKLVQGPANLHTEKGEYVVAEPQDGQPLRIRRAPFSVPPFETEVNVGPGDATAPCLAQDPLTERLFVLYGDEEATMQQHSDDDAASFRGETSVFQQGQQPRIAVDGRRYVLRAAWVETDPGSGTGEIRGVAQEPGDPEWGEEFAFAGADDPDTELTWEPDGFDLSFAGDEPGRLLLIAKAAGDTEFSNWQSWDDGRTWTRID
jgi:hypothetical protein